MLIGLELTKFDPSSVTAREDGESNPQPCCVAIQYAYFDSYLLLLTPKAMQVIYTVKSNNRFMTTSDKTSRYLRINRRTRQSYPDG